MKKETAQAQIHEMVKRIQEVHPSGEKFFDALDEELNSESSLEIFEALLETVPEGTAIVISGGFGKQLHSLMREEKVKHIPHILFKGGIRKGGTPEIITVSPDFPTAGTHSEAIFLDDSIYGGRTFDVLRSFMEGYNPTMKFEKCYVIYDGNPHKREWVASLFRYYDFFEAKPNFEFDEAGNPKNYA